MSPSPYGNTAFTPIVYGLKSKSTVTRTLNSNFTPIAAGQVGWVEATYNILCDTAAITFTVTPGGGGRGRVTLNINASEFDRDEGYHTPGGTLIVGIGITIAWGKILKVTGKFFPGDVVNLTTLQVSGTATFTSLQSTEYLYAPV